MGVRHANIQHVDLGWDTDAPDPDKPVLTVVDGAANPEPSAPNLRVIRAEAGRSDDKRPLPGLPPLPDPRAVLASRVLRRASPGSVAAELARAVVRNASQTVDEEPSAATPTRRAGALPAPVRQHVAFARLRRHGATWHIGPARLPSHARLARLGTPAPVDDGLATLPDTPAPRIGDDDSCRNKPSFWKRMLGRT